MRHVRGGFPSLQQRQRVAVLAGFATLTAMSLVLGGCGATSVQTYDVVVANGRVMDPETGLDAVRHVGIVGSTIRALSERPLHGTLVIDANGLVVAPGQAGSSHSVQLSG